MKMPSFITPRTGFSFAVNQPVLNIPYLTPKSKSLHHFGTSNCFWQMRDTFTKWRQYLLLPLQQILGTLIKKTRNRLIDLCHVAMRMFTSHHITLLSSVTQYIPIAQTMINLHSGYRRTNFVMSCLYNMHIGLNSKLDKFLTSHQQITISYKIFIINWQLHMLADQYCHEF